MSYLSIAFVVIIILLVLLVAFLIAYTIILQRSNTEYKERNAELENEMKDFDETKAECKAQENNFNDRLDNITQALTNCSNGLVTCTECCANSSHPGVEIPANCSDSCTDLKSNYTDIYNKYSLLIGINNELDSDLKELRENYDHLQVNNTELQKENSELLTNIKVLKAAKYQDEILDEVLRMEIGELWQQSTIMGEEKARLVSEIKQIRNHLKSQVLDEQGRCKGFINMHIQEESLVKSNLINLKNELSNCDEQFQKIKKDLVSFKNTPEETYRQEIVILNNQNWQLKNNNYILKAEIVRLNGDKANLKSSLILSLHSRHTNSDMGTNTDDLSNRFIKMKYEDLVYQQTIFVENMNNKLNDLSAENIRLKHNIIMGNERLKARKTVHKEKESYTPNDEIFRKQIEDLLDESTNNNQRLHAQIERLKEDKISLKSLLSSLKKGNLTQKSETTDPEDEIFRQEIELLNGQNSALRVKNDGLNKEVDTLKAEIVRLNGDKANLKSSLILSLHSRHTNSDMGTNTDDLSNRFIKMKYEDLVYQQTIFVENMNNKLNDLSAENIRLKHNIIMGNERLKARKTVHKEKESYTPNDEIFRKQIEDLLDESTNNNQRLHAQIERLKEDKISLKSLLSSLKKGNLTQKSETTDPEDEIFRQEIELLNGQNSALRVKNDGLNKEVDTLKAEIVRLNGDKANLKSSLILSLHSRHTNSDMGTNTDDLSNRFIKMKYEDLVYQQTIFVENMNNKLNDLSAENIRLKHNIIMGNERLKARKTVHKEKEALLHNNVLLRKHIGDLLEVNTWFKQRFQIRIACINVVYRKQIEDDKYQNIQKNSNLKEQISSLKTDKLNIKHFLGEQSAKRNIENKQKEHYSNTIFLKRQLEGIELKLNIFSRNTFLQLFNLRNANFNLKQGLLLQKENLKGIKNYHTTQNSSSNDEIFRLQIQNLVDQNRGTSKKLEEQISQLKRDKIYLKDHLTKNQGNVNIKSKKEDGYYTNTIIMKKKLEGIGVEQRRFVNNIDTKLGELRRTNNKLKEQLLLEREFVRTFKKNQAEIAYSPDRSLRREILDLGYLNSKISIRNEHLAAELEMVSKDKLNMKVLLTYPHNSHILTATYLNTEVKTKNFLKQEISSLRVECDQSVQNRDQRIEQISKDKFRTKSQTSDLLSHYEHDKQRSRIKITTFIENTKEFKNRLSIRQLLTYKTQSIMETINYMKASLINNKKSFTTLEYKHGLLKSKMNTQNNHLQAQSINLKGELEIYRHSQLPLITLLVNYNSIKYKLSLVELKGEQRVDKLLTNNKLTNMRNEVVQMKDLLKHILSGEEIGTRHREYNLEHQRTIIGKTKQELSMGDNTQKVCKEKLFDANEELEYVDYLREVLAREEAEKDTLINSITQLEADYNELRVHDSRLQLLWGSSEHLYKVKLPAQYAYSYLPYPIQMLVVEGGKVWKKYIRQLDRVDDDGVTIKGQITSRDIPEVVPVGTYKRGEIVDSIYYMAPSETGSTILIVNLEDLSFREVDLVPVAGDSIGPEIMECTSMYNGLGVCCKENGFIYSYDFDNYADAGQVPALYYQLTEGTGAIVTCKGMTTERLTIGDGDRIFVYKKDDGSLVYSSSIPNDQSYTQRQMIQLGDDSVLVTQGLYYIVFNYVTVKSTVERYPPGYGTDYYYGLVSPITSDRETAFAMTLFDPEYSTTTINFYYFDSQNTDLSSDKPIELKDLALGPCSQWRPSLMKEFDTASSLIFYMRTPSGDCNQLCIYNYARQEKNCKEFDDSIDITDLIFSPFAY